MVSRFWDISSGIGPCLPLAGDCANFTPTPEENNHTAPTTLKAPVFKISYRAPFHSYKSLLRSPVFKSMLKTNMVESRWGRIVLPDVEVKTGRDLLFFLYNGRMKPDSDLVGLLSLADKYDIQVNLLV